MDEIVLDKLGLELAGRAVLSDISLRLSEGRVGIVGRNGSGKTSLLRVMAGLVQASTGRVSVNGRDPWVDRKAMLRAIGILFQNPDHQILFPTVAEELAFGLMQIGLAREEAAARVSAVLAAEGRGHWAGAPTHTLSQGQKQYLCLMAVLAMEPEWLLLDEPFASLDLPSELRLRRRLAGLAQHVVVISHDPDAVAEMDRVIWIEAGRIRADGTPGAVLPKFRDEMARLGAADADTDLSA